MHPSLLTFSLPYPQLLLILFLVTFIIYVIGSLIFVYHWRAYATNATVLRRTLLVYFVGSGLCLVISGVAVLSL